MQFGAEGRDSSISEVGQSWLRLTLSFSFTLSFTLGAPPQALHLPMLVPTEDEMPSAQLETMNLPTGLMSLIEGLSRKARSELKHPS